METGWRTVRVSGGLGVGDGGGDLMGQEDRDAALLTAGQVTWLVAVTRKANQPWAP